MLMPCFIAPAALRGACLPATSLLRSRIKAPIGRSASGPGRLSLSPHLVSRRSSLVARAGADQPDAIETASSTALKFVVRGLPQHQRPLLVGAAPALGAWDLLEALSMVPGRDAGTWEADLDVPVSWAGKRIEFKVVLVGGQSAEWEPGANRALQMPAVLHKRRKGGAQAQAEVSCEWGNIGAQPTVVPEPAGGKRDIKCCVVVPFKAATPLQRLVLVGSSPQLGRWFPGQGLELTRQEGDTWLAEVMLPEGQPIDAKLVLIGSDGSQQWEGGDNHSFVLELPRKSGQQSTDEEDDGERGDEPAVALVIHWELSCFQLLDLPDGKPPRVIASPPSSSSAPLASSPDAGAAAQRVASLAPVEVRFLLARLETLPGQHVLLVGEAPELGSWNPANGLAMVWQPGHAWAASAQFPASYEGEYKVVVHDSGRYIWEKGDNRMLSARSLAASMSEAESLPPMGYYTLYWQDPSCSPLLAVHCPPELELVDAEVAVGLGQQLEGGGPSRKRRTRKQPVVVIDEAQEQEVTQLNYAAAQSQLELQELQDLLQESRKALEAQREVAEALQRQLLEEAAKKSEAEQALAAAVEQQQLLQNARREEMEQAMALEQALALEQAIAVYTEEEPQESARQKEGIDRLVKAHREEIERLQQQNELSIAARLEELSARHQREMMKAQAAAQERAEQSVVELMQEVSRTHQEEMASLMQQNEKALSTQIQQLSASHQEELQRIQEATEQTIKERMEKANALHQAQLSTVQATAQKALDGLTQELQGLSQERRELMSRIQLFESAVRQYETSQAGQMQLANAAADAAKQALAASLSEQLNRAAVDRQALASERQALDLERRTAEQALEAEMRAVQSALAAQQQQLQNDRRALDEQRAQVDADLEAIKEQQAAQAARSEELQQEWAKLEAEKKALSSSLGDQEQQLASERAALAAERLAMAAAMNEERERLNAERSELARLWEVLEFEKRALADERGQLEVEREKVARSFGDQVQNLANERAKLEQSIKAKGEKLERMRAALDNSLNKKKEQQLNADRASLEASLDTAQQWQGRDKLAAGRGAPGEPRGPESEGAAEQRRQMQQEMQQLAAMLAEKEAQLGEQRQLLAASLAEKEKLLNEKKEALAASLAEKEAQLNEKREALAAKLAAQEAKAMAEKAAVKRQLEAQMSTQRRLLQEAKTNDVQAMKDKVQALQAMVSGQEQALADLRAKAAGKGLAAGEAAPAETSSRQAEGGEGGGLLEGLLGGLLGGGKTSTAGDPPAEQSEAKERKAGATGKSSVAPFTPSAAAAATDEEKRAAGGGIMGWLFGGGVEEVSDSSSLGQPDRPDMVDVAAVPSSSPAPEELVSPAEAAVFASASSSPGPASAPALEKRSASRLRPARNLPRQEATYTSKRQSAVSASASNGNQVLQPSAAAIFTWLHIMARQQSALLSSNEAVTK